MLVLVLLAFALPLGLWIASSKYARRHERAGDWDAEGPRHPSGPRWRGPAAIGSLLGGSAFLAMHGEPGEIPPPDTDVIVDSGTSSGEARAPSPPFSVAGDEDDDEFDPADDEDADSGLDYR